MKFLIKNRPINIESVSGRPLITTEDIELYLPNPFTNSELQTVLSRLLAEWWQAGHDVGYDAGYDLGVRDTEEDHTRMYADL